MSIPDQDRQNLRTGIETAVRMAGCADRTDTWVDVRGGLDEQYFHLDVFKRDESVVPPPLSDLKQVALSFLLDEGVPPLVMLSALEDAGVLGDGAAVEAQRLRDAGYLVFPKHEYERSEEMLDGMERWREFGQPVFSRRAEELRNLQRWTFSRIRPLADEACMRFLMQWFGTGVAAAHDNGRMLWPTADSLIRASGTMPDARAIVNHLAVTSSGRTQVYMTEMLNKLDSVPAPNLGG